MAITQSERVRCRNPRCRSKLPVPTDNDHKAFCTPYCYDQFYNRKCAVCEKDLPREGRRRTLCRSVECRREFNRYRHAYVLSPEPNRNSDSKSAHFTGAKSAHNGDRARIIAGPALSEFALWAATLEPPKPPPINKPAWHLQRQSGDLAAEWTARELARREADDKQLVADDEERLRTEPFDLSGNYAPQADGEWHDWPPSEAAP